MSAEPDKLILWLFQVVRRFNRDMRKPFCGIVHLYCSMFTPAASLTVSVDDADKIMLDEDVSLFGNVDPLVGQKIADRWEITQLLGEGSMSMVYRAKELPTGRPIVLKLLHPHLLAKVPNFKKFEQRAKANANLRHARVANFHDFHLTSDGQIYLICDFLTGESLEDVLSKNGHLSVPRSIDIFIQACEALDYAHNEKVLHRDLKPSNIVLLPGKEGEQVKIVDFGIAKLLSDESDEVKSNQYITHTREVFGSPLYMSPEQCMGKKLDARSDIYSMGCVMYETISGKPPFVGKNVLETAYKHMNEAPRPLSERSNDPLLSRYESIIMKCLAKDPDNRYQIVSEVGGDLQLAKTATDEEWTENAAALKKSTRVKKKDRKGNLPISFEMMVFAGASIVLVLVVSVWSLSFLAGESQDYPAFNNDLLWVVIANEKKKVSTVQDFGSREERLRMRLQSIEREQGPECREYADVTFELVSLYEKAGHYQDASLQLKKLIDLIKKVGGPINEGDAYRHLAYAYFMQNELNEAERAANTALPLLESIVGRQHTGLTLPLNILADIYTQKGDLAQAQSKYEQLIAIADGAKGTEPLQYANVCSKLADIYRRQNKLEEAERYYRQGLEWSQNTVGKENAFVPKTYYGLGLTLMAAKKYPEAEQMFKDALPLAKSALGDRSALVGAIRKQYSEVLWKTNWMGALMLKMGSADPASK